MRQTILLNSIPATTAMVALAVGYIVLILARKESGRIRLIGNTIGVFVIIASSLLILAKLALLSACSNRCDMPLMRYKIMQERQMLEQTPTAPLPKK